MLRFRLSTLLLILTVFAILIAWIVDHRSLSQKLRPDIERITFIQALSNAKNGDMITQLQDLFPDQVFMYNKMNSIMIHTTMRERDRIKKIIEHLDQPQTPIDPVK